MIDELEHSTTCAFCGDQFSRSDLGSLSCRFHPMAVYARCGRTIAHSSAETLGRCAVCVKLHVPSELRDPLQPDERLPRYACTRVDHTSDPARLFDNLIVGTPTFFASNLSLSLLTVGAPSARANVLLVDSPERLASRLVYVVPGLGEFSRAVIDVYRCMAETFHLSTLDEAMREARRAVSRTVTYSERSGMKVPGLDNKKLLYEKQVGSVTFVPFYIVARVEQRRGDMRFDE